MFVQLINGKIKKVSINYIKKTFFKYIRMLKPFEYNGFYNNGEEWKMLVTNKQIETVALQKVTSLFEEKRLVLFPDKEIKLLQDTLDKHYTFFKNCYIISDKSGYKVMDYEQLKDGYVWDDAVLDRDYHEPKDTAPGTFEKFVHDISGNKWDLETDSSAYPERSRYQSLLIAGGYLLHNFTNMKRKAVILTQGRISEDDTSEGREGKTMFVKSLGRHMLNKDPKKSKTFVVVPGKDLDSKDKHRWQDIDMNTTCVLYDDPPAWISFENLYNVAEDAFRVEKKNQQSESIESRIFITTNRPIDRESGSSKDRSCVIELDSIFSADYSPEEKYKEYFFRDWTGGKAGEWDKFSKFVLGTMLPAYFANKCNLLEPPSKNLYRNELLQKARQLTGGVEVIFWLDALTRGDDENEPYFKHTESYSTKDLFQRLLNDQDVSENKKLKRHFAKIVKNYFDKEGITYEQSRHASGTVFKLLSGLPEAIKVEQQYVASFFNNGNGYKPEDVQDSETLKAITEEFNKKFNTAYPALALKKTVEEMESDLPF